MKKCVLKGPEIVFDYVRLLILKDRGGIFINARAFPTAKVLADPQSLFTPCKVGALQAFDFNEKTKDIEFENALTSNNDENALFYLQINNENNLNLISNAIIGTTKDHDFVKEMLKSLEEYLSSSQSELISGAQTLSAFARAKVEAKAAALCIASANTLTAARNDANGANVAAKKKRRALQDYPSAASGDDDEPEEQVSKGGGVDTGASGANGLASVADNNEDGEEVASNGGIVLGLELPVLAMIAGGLVCCLLGAVLCAVLVRGNSKSSSSKATSSASGRASHARSRNHSRRQSRHFNPTQHSQYMSVGGGNGGGGGGQNALFAMGMGTGTQSMYAAASQGGAGNSSSAGTFNTSSTLQYSAADHYGRAAPPDNNYGTLSIAGTQYIQP